MRAVVGSSRILNGARFGLVRSIEDHDGFYDLRGLKRSALSCHLCALLCYTAARENHPPHSQPLHIEIRLLQETLRHHFAMRLADGRGWASSWLDLKDGSGTGIQLTTATMCSSLTDTRIPICNRPPGS